ncbi:MAG: hypothetical protein WD096_05610 [Actinomycetota bacterium]
MRRRIARLVLALVFSVASLVIVTTPAFACSCVSQPAGMIIRDADAVLVGEVVGDRLVQDGTMQRVRVDEVFVGTLPPEIEVYAAIGPGIVDTCSVLFSGGHEVAMVLEEDAAGRSWQSLCSMLSVEDVRRLGGTPRPPDPDAVAPTQTPPVVDTEAEGALLAWWQVVGLGALAAAALMGGSILAGLRRARRVGTASLPEEAPPPEQAG